MAERFERLFYLPENLYTEKSPVLIRNGVLTIDRESGRLFAQLKLECLSDKVIRSAKVRLSLSDTANRVLGEPITYEYLDLNCARDDSFGGKTAIPLPDNHARSFTASITEVVFTDGEIWSEENAEWKAIPKQTELSTVFGDENAVAFPILFGEEGKYLPMEKEGLWFCTCGAINWDTENVCHVCKEALADLKAITKEQVAEQTETIRKDAIYASGCHLSSKNTISSYEEAIRQFESIPDWKDAGEKIPECKRAIEQLRISAKKTKKLAAIITPIVVACVAFVIVLMTVIIPNGKYNAAVDLYNAGKYDEAISAFRALNGYKDSEIQITKCETAINDSKYNTAVDLYNAGKYDEAITAFKELNGYKDSDTQLENCYLGKYGEEKYNLIKNIKVGDTYKFGSYEQDNKTANGKEDIEWIVLAREGERILVISSYALDCKPYNTSYTSVTWENCPLRKWLNETFLSTAFSPEEQNSIVSSTVTADKNPSYSTSPGNNTTDKVFLLSITEVNKYFKSNDARKCAPTDYAIAQGAYTSDSYSTGGRTTCWWWLRSPGWRSDLAAGVRLDGSVFDNGSSVDGDDDAVRPALWIDLSE